MTQLEELRRQGKKMDSVDVLSVTYADKGMEHAQKGDWEQAAAWHVKARQVQQDARGPWHHEVASFSNSIAVMYLQGGQPKEALPYLLEGLKIFRANQTEDHLEGILCRNFLAMAYIQLDQSDKALEQLRRVVELQEKAWGKSHPKTIDARVNLGVGYATKYTDKDMQKAYDNLALAWQMHCARGEGSNSRGKASCAYNLAVVCTSGRNFDHALHYCQQALDILRKIPGRDEHVPRLLFDASVGMAQMCMHANKRDQAVAALEQALRILEQDRSGHDNTEITRKTQHMIEQARQGKSIGFPAPHVHFSFQERDLDSRE